MKIMLLSLITCLCLNTVSLNAKDPQNESIYLFLSNPNIPDTAKILVCDSIVDANIFSHPDLAFTFASKGLDIARKIKSDYWDVTFVCDIGKLYDINGNYELALDTTLWALHRSQNISNDLLVCRCLNYLGLIYTDVASYDEAIENYRNLLFLAESGKRDFFIARGYNNLGSTYYLAGKIDSSFYFTNQAFQMYLTRSDSNFMMGPIFLRLAKIFKSWNKLDVALDYARNGIQYSQKISDSLSTATGLRIIAGIFQQKNIPDSCIKYGLASYKLASEISFEKEVLDVSTILAWAYGSKKDYKNGFEFQKNASIAYDSLFNMDKIKQRHIRIAKEKIETEKRRNFEAGQKKKIKDRIEILTIVICAAILLSIVLVFCLTNIFPNNKNYPCLAKIIKPGVVRVLGYFVLLMIFELIKMLLNPWIESVSDYTPIRSLCILIAIALVLGFFNDKIESWINTKLNK